MSKEIILAEPLFESIQGEGNKVGVSSLFLRFSGCNFKCSFCDSKFTWGGTVTEVKYKLDDLMAELRKSTCTNLVITGGEPTLYQDVLTDILSECLPFKSIEIESNGSISYSYDFIKTVKSRKNIQFNISPKVQFEDSIEQVRKNVNTLYAEEIPYIVKFVDDRTPKTRKLILDMMCFTDYYNSFRKDKIYVMPECISRDEHIERAQSTIDFCKDTGYNFSPRLHILLWDKKRGV